VGRGVSRGKTVSGRVINETISGDNLFKANKDHHKSQSIPQIFKTVVDLVAARP
jgi:hypothetical protein